MGVVVCVFGVFSGPGVTYTLQSHTHTVLACALLCAFCSRICALAAAPPLCTGGGGSGAGGAKEGRQGGAPRQAAQDARPQVCTVPHPRSITLPLAIVHTRHPRTGCRL